MESVAASVDAGTEPVSAVPAVDEGAEADTLDDSAYGDADAFWGYAGTNAGVAS